MTRLLCSFAACFTLLLAVGCGDDSAPTGCPETGCPAGSTCVDDVCQLVGDGGVGGDTAVDMTTADMGDMATCQPDKTCENGRACCSETEECVDGLACDPICDGERCGDNRLTCCATGQVCLDGVVCAAACAAEETLCGADLSLCCAAGDVCVDSACATPGAECGDDFDCLEDDTYCEPTIGRCLSNPAPPLCEVRPEFEDVELEVEWHWEGLEIGGEDFRQVIATPVVGDVSGDGIPDVVVAAYAGASGARTILVALDGSDGTLLWNVPPGDAGPVWTMTAALGNLDPSDEALEVVYRSRNDGIRVLDGDGTTVLAEFDAGSGATSDNVSPAIADIDQDGTFEIIAGCQVLNFREAGGAFELSERFDAGPCASESQSFAATAVANLDADPALEITSGAIAVNDDGTPLWSMGSAHGRIAIADLDMDGAPEVISIRGDTGLFVRDGLSGEVRIGAGGSWLDATASLPGGGNGGAPTVADFDGDGLPEVSTAGRGCYVVYDLDCMDTPPREGGDCTRPAYDPETTCDDSPGQLVRWARPTQDISSSSTGSSVFDFQGDGVSEVIYNDECFLHIYDGRDGRELLSAFQPNSSRTGVEYPLVVDVDRDGNSEIVVPANNDQAVGRDGCPAAYAEALGVTVGELPAEFASGTNGVFVLGDPRDRWVRTRPIWNEYTYRVTNVGDRGEIPREEAPNWLEPRLNNFRQNVQGAGVFNAPNLQVALEAVAACSEGNVRLSAVVTNAGSRGVEAGIAVEFRQTAPMSMLLATESTTGPLLPGGSERVTVVVEASVLGEDLVYEAVVNGGDSSVVECIDDDNDDSAMERCTPII
ncbi:MAG: hypothetical protein AAF938_10310 [Myxococcota bacterium]